MYCAHCDKPIRGEYKSVFKESHRAGATEFRMHPECAPQEPSKLKRRTPRQPKKQ